MSELAFCYSDKTLIKGKLGKEGVYFRVSITVHYAGASGRELDAGTKGKTSESTAYWLAFHGWLSLLSNKI